MTLKKGEAFLPAMKTAAAAIAEMLTPIGASAASTPLRRRVDPGRKDRAA
jgi:hypothetical protein